MTSSRALIVVAACTVVAGVAGQAPSEPPRFRIAVDGVSIDAVVTDRSGQVVRDLTAADFDVFQNGKRQKVTFAQFVPVSTGAVFAPGGREASEPMPNSTGAVPLAAPPVTRAQVRRTFLFVVDDLGLSVEGMRHTREALRRFVETELLPTDLAAIVRTGESLGVPQALTNDRRRLQATIAALRYNVLSRKGVSPSGDVNQLGDQPPTIEDVEPLQASMSMSGSFAALHLVVRAARDLPGRKTVILASEGFPLAFERDGQTLSGLDPRAPRRVDRASEPPKAASTENRAIANGDPRVRSGFDRVIDQATRSGVVIYAIDSGALQPSGFRAADNVHSAGTGVDAMGAQLRGLAAERQRVLTSAQETLAYLAEQTGGFAVLNTNDLAAGLSRISHDIRDYYVIGYQPDETTFTPQSGALRRHTITVRVRREGLRVRARKEFIGLADPDRPSGPATAAEQLVRAAISPFSEAAIALRATNLPGYAPGLGVFVRTVLHVDAQALAFSTDAGGTRTASADLVGLLYDRDGVQVDTITTGFDVTLTPAAAAQALAQGLVYTARVPVAKAGGYQLRYAVRDRRSGSIGAVGGFVVVPAVTDGALALSGLVVRGGDGSAPGTAIDDDRFSLSPADARGIYAPGTPLSYSYQIYNARTAVQAVTSLWRGTEQIASSPPDLLPPPAEGPLLATGRLALAGDLPAGAYVLQVAVTAADRAPARKTRAVIQRLSFEVK